MQTKYYGNYSFLGHRHYFTKTVLFQTDGQYFIVVHRKMKSLTTVWFLCCCSSIGVGVSHLAFRIELIWNISQKPVFSQRKERNINMRSDYRAIKTEKYTVTTWILKSVFKKLSLLNTSLIWLWDTIFFNAFVLKTSLSVCLDGAMG